jgi:hypothetical protein
MAAAASLAHSRQALPERVSSGARIALTVAAVALLARP